MRCFALILLNYKIISAKSAKGVSAKSLELYLILFLFRVMAIMRHSGYLPFDKTGDWFYHLVEVVSLSSCGVALYLLFVPLRPTYSEKYDKFGNLHVPNEFGAVYLGVPTLIFAILFHP
jgi:hypothetical protein